MRSERFRGFLKCKNKCRRRVLGLPLRGPGVYLNPLSLIGSSQEGRKKLSDTRTFLIWVQESRDVSRDDSRDDLQDNTLQHHRPVPLTPAPPTRASPLRRPSAMATGSFSSAAAPGSAKPSGHCPLCTRLRTLLPDLEDASTYRRVPLLGPLSSKKGQLPC